jgi:hypothetical protein
MVINKLVRNNLKLPIPSVVFEFIPLEIFKA